MLPSSSTVSAWVSTLAPSDGSPALAPEHQFPTQLRQASAALAHLLDTGVPAGDIIIGGDSAGGNLALTLLSHLQHPHPDLPPVPLAAPLSGAFVVSPGVSRDVQGIPMRTEDSVHPRAYVNWYAAAPGGDVGVWSGASALFAADGWWAPLAAVTRRVLVTTGSAEAFSSRQIAFAQRLLVESPGTQVECVEEEGAVHISPISDLAALGDGPGKAAKHIAQWVAAV
jgi:acetyl esterase/lipase